MLLMGCRRRNVLGSTKLAIHNGILLRPPHLRRLRLNIRYPAFDRRDALLTVAVMFRVEVIRPV
ncbi:hypothetical protein C463_12037 [Halorubrum californiense DSM 19288]|uniref:Uncharacterized protein n=1 Tax=Halorubrum californiense DSM 19288 TaxID=1227465 RepID=M0E3Y8_9EURY|nr:hypothetical protein C463_12037 [Halorubrum californiense DSM 19288]